MLAFVAIKFFYSRCIKLIEKVTVNKTLVIVWKQIKNIAGGEQSDIKRDGRLFERNIHQWVIVFSVSYNFTMIGYVFGQPPSRVQRIAAILNVRDGVANPVPRRLQIQTYIGVKIYGK